MVSERVASLGSVKELLAQHLMSVDRGFRCFRGYQVRSTEVLILK